MLSNHRGFPRSVLKPGLAGALAVFLFTLSPPGHGAAVVSIITGIGAEYIAPAPAISVTFRFAVVDVANTTPGQDLWEYSYTPADFAFAAGQGFTIAFDRTLFTLLQSPPPFVNADWDPLTLQPDLALGSNGLYDALALRNAPSLADPFKIKVVWLGTGTPGAQPFTIYDTNFQPIVQGQTTSVPEPSALALLLLQGAAISNRRPSRSSRSDPSSAPPATGD